MRSCRSIIAARLGRPGFQQAQNSITDSNANRLMVIVRTWRIRDNFSHFSLPVLSASPEQVISSRPLVFCSYQPGLGGITKDKMKIWGWTCHRIDWPFVHSPLACIMAFYCYKIHFTSPKKVKGTRGDRRVLVRVHHTCGAKHLSLEGWGCFKQI